MTWILLGIFALLCPLARAVEVNTNMAQLERSLEKALQEKLDSLTGESSRIMVSVSMREEPSDRQEEELSFESFETLDFAYAPVPLSAPRKLASKPDRIKIAKTAVELFAPAEIPDEMVENATLLAKSALKGFSPVVSVKRWAPPVKPEEAEPTLLSRLNLEAKDLLPYVTALLAAMLALCAVYLIARAMGGMGMAMTNTVQGLGSEGINLAREFMEKSDRKDEEAEKLSAMASVPPPSAEDTARNLQLARHMLKENLPLFVHVLNEEESDLRGLKWLLPLFSEPEQEALKEGLGNRRLGSLRAFNQESAGTQDVWLQDFVERLMVQKLMGGSIVEKALGPDLISAFTLADPKLLVSAVKETKSKAAWRILAEFIPNAQLSEYLHHLDDEQWVHLLSSADVSIEEIRQVGEQMKDLLKTLSVRSDEAESRTDFYRDRLLGPTLDAISKQDLGVQDQLLTRLSGLQPEFASLIRERVWTAAQIAQVPDEHLVNRLKGLSYVQIASLLVSLPPKTSERLEKLLPDGNLRLMAIDQKGRMQSRDSQKQRHLAAVICRQFIESLRIEAQDKVFELLPEEHKSQERSAA